MPTTILRTSLTALVAVWLGSVVCTAATAQQTTGVGTCDTFLTQYETCIADKVPSEHQAQFKATLYSMRNAVVPLSQNPQTRDNLDGVCRQMAAVVKQQTSAIGCAW